MNKFGGNETFLRARLFPQVQFWVGWNMHVRAALIVKLRRTMEFGRLCLCNVILIRSGCFRRRWEYRGYDAFFHPFLIRSKLLARYRFIFLISNVIALIFCPRTKVGAISFYNAAVALLLPLRPD